MVGDVPRLGVEDIDTSSRRRPSPVPPIIIRRLDRTTLHLKHSSVNATYYLSIWVAVVPVSTPSEGESMGAPRMEMINPLK